MRPGRWGPGGPGLHTAREEAGIRVPEARHRLAQVGPVAILGFFREGDVLAVRDEALAAAARDAPPIQLCQGRPATSLTAPRVWRALGHAALAAGFSRRSSAAANPGTPPRGAPCRGPGSRGSRPAPRQRSPGG